MSQLYESIPSERKTTYLQNAQAAIEVATQPVASPAIEALGELVVKEAESLTDADAESSQVAYEAQEALASQDSISDQAARYLEKQDRQIKDWVDEITGEKVGKPNFMSMRREYESDYALGRTDLGGRGFGKTNQLWTKMTEQNQQGPENPQAPAS